LTEELFYETEDCSRKVHEQIYCADRPIPSAQTVAAQFKQLLAAAARSESDCRDALQAIVDYHIAQTAAEPPGLRKAA
jgi:hypothetical protein